jgi:hypothetical protein
LKQSTVRLVVVVAAAYYAVFFLVRGFFSSQEKIPLFLLAGPLALVVAVLASDLANRATVPVPTRTRTRPSRRFSREVQSLAREIDVGRRASWSYFETVLLSRMRELLVDKVSLETGMEKTRAQELLKNPALGPGLLRDEALYRLLYNAALARGPGRVRLLEEAVAGIEAWKP